MKNLLLSFVLLFCFAHDARAADPPAAEPPTMSQSEALRHLTSLPPGTRVEFEMTTKEGGTVKVKETGKGVGAGAEAVGDKLSDQFTGSAPTVGLGNGRGASGGDAKGDVQASALPGSKSAWSNPLFWVGLLMLVGAGVLLYMRIPGLGGLPTFLGAGGGVLIVISFYSAIMLWAVAGVILFFMWPTIKSHLDKSKIGDELKATQASVGVFQARADQFREAVRAVAAGVEDISDEALRKQVKESISKHADETDKLVIREVKKDDRLGERA